MKNLQFSILNFKLLIVAIITLAIGYFLTANGQTSLELLVSWKSLSYAPSDYQGKILPAKDSAIILSFDLIDSGRIANISKNEVRWKIGTNVIDSGLGLKNNVFQISKLSSENLTVSITVLNYNSRNIQKTITIPIADPEVIIKQIENNSFSAKPYFFNVDNINELGFEWSVNGEKPQGYPKDPSILTIENINISSEIPIGLELNLKVSVAKILNQLERALGRLTINL